MSLWDATISGFLGGFIGAAVPSQPVKTTTQIKTEEVSRQNLVAWEVPAGIDHVITPHPDPEPAIQNSDTKDIEPVWEPGYRDEDGNGFA